MATVNPATSAFDFADQLALMSSQLLRYRIKNQKKLDPAERADLLELELQLDKATAEVRAAGIAELGVFAAGARSEIVTATEQADVFLKRIRKVEKVIGVLTAIVGLGLAVVGRNPGEILAAAKAVKDAVKP